MAFANRVADEMRSSVRRIVGIATVAARLTSLRVRLPRLLDDGALPDAFARLDPAAPRNSTRSAAPFATVVRGITLGEAAVRRLRRARVPDTCLYRSCARYALLREHGVAAELVLGVRGQSGSIEGHAWVEVDGVPFLERLDGALVENFRHPPRKRDL